MWTWSWKYPTTYLIHVSPTGHFIFLFIFYLPFLITLPLWFTFPLPFIIPPTFFLCYHCPPKLSDPQMRHILHHWLGFHWYCNEMYTQHPLLAITFLSTAASALSHISLFWYPVPQTLTPHLTPVMPEPLSGSLHSVSSHIKQAPMLLFTKADTKNFHICRGRERWGWFLWPLRGVLGSDRGHVVPQADVTRTKQQAGGAATGRKTCWGTKTLQTGKSPISPLKLSLLYSWTMQHLAHSLISYHNYLISHITTIDLIIVCTALPVFCFFFNLCPSCSDSLDSRHRRGQEGRGDSLSPLSGLLWHGTARSQGSDPD